MLLELYRRARDLVAKGWTQEFFARDAKGEQCQVKNGVYFCALGALSRAATDMNPTDTQRLCKDEPLRVFAASQGFHSVAKWNDNSTKEQVLAGFDHCIKELENAA